MTDAQPVRMEMTRGEVVLTHGGTTPLGTGEVFQSPPMDGDRRVMVLMDGDTWVDLGAPTTITATIEPGDLVNALPPEYAPTLERATTAQLLNEVLERIGGDDPRLGRIRTEVHDLVAFLTDDELGYTPARATEPVG